MPTAQHSEEISDYRLHTWGLQLRQFPLTWFLVVRIFTCTSIKLCKWGNLCQFIRLRDSNKHIDIELLNNKLHGLLPPGGFVIPLADLNHFRLTKGFPKTRSII